LLKELYRRATALTKKFKLNEITAAYASHQARVGRIQVRIPPQPDESFNPDELLIQMARSHHFVENAKTPEEAEEGRASISACEIEFLTKFSKKTLTQRMEKEKPDPHAIQTILVLGERALKSRCAISWNFLSGFTKKMCFLKGPDGKKFRTMLIYALYDHVRIFLPGYVADVLTQMAVEGPWKNVTFDWQV
jgi:hypothetical protein